MCLVSSQHALFRPFPPGANPTYRSIVEQAPGGKSSKNLRIGSSKAHLHPCAKDFAHGYRTLFLRNVIKQYAHTGTQEIRKFIQGAKRLRSIRLIFKGIVARANLNPRSTFVAFIYWFQNTFFFSFPEFLSSRLIFLRARNRNRNRKEM